MAHCHCLSQTENDVRPMQSESVSFRKRLQVMCVCPFRDVAAHAGALLPQQ